MNEWEKFVLKRGHLKVIFTLYVDQEKKIIHLLDLHQEGTLWLVNTLDQDLQETIIDKLRRTYGNLGFSDYRWFLYEPVRISEYRADAKAFNRQFLTVKETCDLYPKFVEKVNSISV